MLLINALLPASAGQAVVLTTSNDKQRQKMTSLWQHYSLEISEPN